MTETIPVLLPPRPAYAPAATSMERHVLALVNFLEHGVANRGEFNRAIEAAQARAYSLEAEIVNTRREMAALERCIAIATPSLHIHMDMLDMAEGAGRYDDTSSVMQCFDWQMDAVRYRVMLREDQARGDEKLKASIKRATYKGVLRKFREQFEACFNLNPVFHRQVHRRRKIEGAVLAAKAHQAHQAP